MKRLLPTRRVALLFAAMIVLVPMVAWAAPSEFDKAREQGWVWAFLVAFGTGVVTSLTPCVYPMIPIVVGIFGAKEASRLRGFFLATMYVCGMGVMFAGLGILAALTGRAMGSILANPYVVVPMVVLYVALAASMFGAFELNLPASLQAKLSGVGGKGTGGAFAMGLVGGLTAAPCTGPFLAGMLAYVATTRSVLLGGTLLFVYAMGIGVLFWVIATFSMSMPKSGMWMELVKVVGGIGLLVVGVYFLRPIWPTLARLTSPRMAFLVGSASVTLAGLALLVGYIMAGYTRAGKMFKAGAIVFGVIGSAGILNWTQTPKKPLPWRYDEVAACTEAKASGRNVLVDFGAEWCKPCKKIETEVFSDPTVYAELSERYIPLKIDVTDDSSEAVRAAKQRWQQNEVLPTVILAGPDCKERRRFQAIMSPDEFLAGARAIR
jgi:thioredoxin:protein disulfide reductase